MCNERLDLLFEQHKLAIRSLASSDEEHYKKIRQQAKRPEAVHFSVQENIYINIQASDPRFETYEKHLYITENGTFSTVLNSWEKETILAEINRKEVVGWVRNYQRKSWALTLPYWDTDRYKPMYPDFLVIRKNRNNYLIDILEPHRGDLDDNWKKAIGLAQFAENHWNSFGRIELIRKIGNQSKRLNLNNDTIRSKVLGVTNNEHLNTIFDTYLV
ncbi:MAG TPA: hypothetical protein DEF42_21945 [Desulfosporosinus sp.]|nr:hypothetical protein [Desulfosporosinus sp.]